MTVIIVHTVIISVMILISSYNFLIHKTGRLSDLIRRDNLYFEIEDWGNKVKKVKTSCANEEILCSTIWFLDLLSKGIFENCFDLGMVILTTLACLWG